MRLNPFRSRSQRRSRRDDADRGVSLGSPRSKVSLFLLAGGVGLFVIAVAVAFVLWPYDGDRTGSASSVALRAPDNGDPATRVGSDRQLAATEVTAAFPERPGGADDGVPQAGSRECQRRRSALAEESRVIDRFDLDSVGNLNIRIGLFNADCASLQVNPRSEGNPAAVAGSNGATNESMPPESAVPTSIEKRTESDARTVAGSATKQGRESRRVKTRTSADQPAAAEGQKNRWNPTVLSVQSLLNKLGYQPGPEDGLIGRRTREAIKKFQADQGLAVDGEVSLELLEAVLAVYPGRASPQKSTSPGGTNSTGNRKVGVQPVKPAATNGEPAAGKQSTVMPQTSQFSLTGRNPMDLLDGLNKRKHKPNMTLLSGDVLASVRRHYDGLQVTELLSMYVWRVG